MRVAIELRAAGHVAYFAGGCVRDRLLGLEPKDHDVATDATPEEIEAIFHRTRGVGQAFGVILVNLAGQSVEVTTFRSDGTYTDFRRPDSVQFAADARSDALRRDFTINGMFEDPESGEIIDHVGGLADLKRGVIRAIGDPEARMREDRLRMLRAIRFSSRLGFEIESGTIRAIREGAGQLEGVSRERIGQETGWMLRHPSRARSAGLIQSFRLDAVVLLERHADAPLERLARLPSEVSVGLALAAWWRDRLALSDTAIEDRHRWKRALVLSNDTFERFRDVLDLADQVESDWESMSVAARKRIAASAAFSDALVLVAASDPRCASHVAADVDGMKAEGLSPPPLLGGADLIGLGLEPGPLFKDVLEAVYNAQLEGRIGTCEEAAQMALRIARERDARDGR